MSIDISAVLQSKLFQTNIQPSTASVTLPSLLILPQNLTLPPLLLTSLFFSSTIPHLSSLIPYDPSPLLTPPLPSLTSLFTFSCHLLLHFRPNIEATQKSKKQKKSSKSTKKKVQGKVQPQQVEEPQPVESRYVGCFASESSFLGKMPTLFMRLLYGM